METSPYPAWRGTLASSRRITGVQAPSLQRWKVEARVVVAHGSARG